MTFTTDLLAVLLMKYLKIATFAFCLSRNDANFILSIISKLIV